MNNNNTSIEPKIVKKNKNKNKTVIIITVISVIAAIILALVGTLAYIMSSDKIYNGVYAGNVSLGGLTKAEAIDLLKAEYDNNDFKITLKYKDISFEVYSSRINMKQDFEETANMAYAYGRVGNVFNRAGDILKLKKSTHTVVPKLTCDMNLLQYEIGQYLSEYVIDVTDYSVEIGEDCLIITNGKAGMGVDPEKLMNKISKVYVNGDFKEAIDIEIEKLEPAKIDPEVFIKEYTRNAEDSRCEQNGENYTVIPHIIGVKIDPDEAKRILEDNKNNDESYIIPAIITYPEVTTEMVEAEFTDTIIATFSTDYSTSSENRKENIRLASEKINGMILNPGEVFSFNDVVGPRTEATGFKIAHVYSGSKVVDGIGGGICQVSSTLYNAVVFADLEIVYRTNHSLPVSYTPLGRDATVSYGTIDFKFKNNKETPVKFEVIPDGNNLTVNVYGRKKYIKDITIETVITGYTPYSINEIEDANLYEDERVVSEKGSNGTRTESYKIVKENGEIVSKTLLSKSSYTPTSEVVKVGTKKREAKQTVTDNTETITEQLPENPTVVPDENLQPNENSGAVLPGSETEVLPESDVAVSSAGE
ncbi:MAG: VanW family protein [Clostridia bacterium]|nr:VanW family protein [Clostridia bacterium]